MKSIVFLGFVFILIIVLTSLLIKQVVEHFAKVDPIITKINTLKKAYKNMHKILGEKKFLDIMLKSVPLTSSVAINKNIINLGELEKTYKLKMKISRDDVTRRKILNDTNQELSAFIGTYNDINAQFTLGLPPFDITQKNPSSRAKKSRKNNNKTAQDYENQFNDQLSMPSRKLNKTLDKQVRRQKPNYLNTKKPKTLASKKPRNLLKVNKRSSSKRPVKKEGPDKTIAQKIRRNIRALFYTPYFG